MYKLSLVGAWEFRQAKTNEWMPATVPGGVHTDLMALGKIPDPFAADNEARVQWVAEADWEYRRSFSVPDALLREEQIYLVCDGLDTLATVFVNGQQVGESDNMFRQYRWEVKQLVKIGTNELAIHFESPVQYVQRKQAEVPLPGVSQAISGGPHLRKAPCQWGWDWGPQLPPIGIWKDLRLEGYSQARFTDVFLRQSHQSKAVTIFAEFQLEQMNDMTVTVQMKVVSPKGKEQVAEAPVVAGKVELSVKNPQLWWPNGYGEQPLYKVTLYLCKGEKVVDERNFQLGLRTLELRRQPDEWGESFTFVVNGVPIFAKGSNWIPADSFPTRISDEYLGGLLTSAVAANQNMLRVWGGGFYEEERFYDLCDRLGILVWQDMIFSCSVYNFDDPALLENIRLEIAENVARIRHRASLALWCGNNEMEMGWEHWGWMFMENAQSFRDAYDRFFHQLLPAWVKDLDPDHAYWPSSPSSWTPFKDSNGQKQGDAHYWDVWHGRKPFTAYRDQYPRFMSEFGFQSLPPLETVRTYAEPKDWNMTSYIMEWHQRSGSGNGLMISQMTDTFRMPKDFPSLTYLSMVLQAEGIRYGVEHWRRNKHRVSGTLIWQLNDCWPVASWSSLDYFGRWKALHYAAKRFYAPVLLSIEDHAELMNVHVTSDLTEAWGGSVGWSLVTLDGKVLKTGHKAVTLAPLASLKVCSEKFDLSPEERRNLVFVADLEHQGQCLARCLGTFAPNKHLNLKDPGFHVEIHKVKGELVINVLARSLARFVEIRIAGKDVVFSDNYFDLPADGTVTVTCPMPAGMTLAQVRKALSISSLYDSF
jgi:beta-mannosidase